MKRIMFILLTVISINCRAEWKEVTNPISSSTMLPFVTSDGFYASPSLGQTNGLLNVNFKTGQLDTYSENPLIKNVFSGVTLGKSSVISCSNPSTFECYILKGESLKDLAKIYTYNQGLIFYSYPLSDSLFFINYAVKSSSIINLYGILNINSGNIETVIINNLKSLPGSALIKRFQKINDTTYTMFLGDGEVVISKNECKTFSSLKEPNPIYKDVLFVDNTLYLLSPDICFVSKDNGLTFTELFNNNSLTNRQFIKLCRANNIIKVASTNTDKNMTEVYSFENNILKSEFVGDKLSGYMICEDNKHAIITGYAVYFNDYSTTSVDNEQILSAGLSLAQTSQGLTIKTDAAAQIKIYDYLGAEVFSGECSGELNVAEYSKFTSGAYFIVAANSDGVKYGRFVK